MFDIKRILNWNKVHVLLMFIGCLLALYNNDLIIFAVIATFSFGLYFWLFRDELNKYTPFAGYANLITLFRIATLLVLCFFWYQLDKSALFLLFLTTILLDWLDGHLARRFNLASDFGLYLDMETDALLVAIISIVIWMTHDFHWLILVSGLLRYPYAVALLLINNGNKKEPKRIYASYATGFLYISLLLVFLTHSSIAEYILYTASLLIIASFSRSLYFQITGS